MRVISARVVYVLAAAAAAMSGCYVVPLDQAHRVHPHAPTTVVQLPSTPNPAPTVVVAAPPAATTLQARLYPVNEAGAQAGVVLAQIVDNHSGRGSLSLYYKGQALNGEATRVDTSYSAFGRIHDHVLGVQSRSYSGRKGVANAFGGTGLSVQCEYVLTAPAMGTGVCLFSDGAKYQFHFGS